MAHSNAGTKAGTDGVGRELAITRVFDAQRELVFKAWADPEGWSQSLDKLAEHLGSS